MPILAEPSVRNHLRRLRLAQGLAQYALAVRAAVSPTIIGAVERYGYRPGAAVRQRIAKALAVAEIDIWPGVVEPGRDFNGSNEI